MHTKIPAVFNWSGGKDSALALYRILQEDKYQVCSLLTTIYIVRQIALAFLYKSSSCLRHVRCWSMKRL